MRKVLLIVTVAVCALLWTSRSQTVYAVGFTTISCQGHDLVIISEGLEISNAALWSVTTLSSKFTGGTLLATFQAGPEETLTCAYQLDVQNSEFFSYNGIVVQNLAWASVDICEDFEDEVFLISSGTQGVMNDTNLDDDGAAGSGTCIVR